MRIAKNTTLSLGQCKERFLLVADAFDGAITAEKEGRALLSLNPDENGGITVSIVTKAESLTLRADNAYRREVILTQGYARLGLYIEGQLVDEQFPMQSLDLSGATLATDTAMHFEDGYEYHSMPESAITPGHPGDLNGFCPFGKGRYMTSVIPAHFDDRLHLFYLDGWQGRCKAGVPVSRLCAIFTEDGKTFSGAPMALPIDRPEECSILLAAMTEQQHRAYLYYIAKTKAGMLFSCAVSEDGFSYIKTGLDVDAPGLVPEAVTSLDVETTEEGMSLLFAMNGFAYRARTVDLLHFAPAEILPLGEGVKAFSSAFDGAYLVEKADGFFLMSLKKPPVSFASPLSAPRLLRYRGEDSLVGLDEQGHIQMLPYTMARS